MQKNKFGKQICLKKKKERERERREKLLPQDKGEKKSLKIKERRRVLK